MNILYIIPRALLLIICFYILFFYQNAEKTFYGIQINKIPFLILGILNIIQLYKHFKNK
jgi:hypothetical protein